MIREKVLQLIADAAEVESVSADAKLDSLSIDSLEFMELILELQRECGVTITDAEIPALHTAEDVIVCVQRHLQ